MYRITEENHLISKRKLYFIEKQRSIFGFTWWNRNLGVDEIDLNPYGYFYTEEQARKVLNIIKSGKTIITKVL